MSTNSIPKLVTLIMAVVLLEGCAATVVAVAVGTVTTVAVETAKIPFKVAGAAVDVVTDEDEDD